MSRKKPYTTGEKSFTRIEYNKLLAVCNTLEDEIMLKLGVELGLRRSDMAALLISNVDFEESKLKYVEKKKGNRIMTVFLSPPLIQLLQKYLNSLPKRQKKVFTCGGRQLYNRLNDLCLKAEIPKRPIHALRATCIKFHQAAGWSITEVAKLIGDSPKVVELHYATPSEDEMRELTHTKNVIT